MKRYIICASPNGRGIHKYAQFLEEELKESELIQCGYVRGMFVLWELLGIVRHWRKLVRADELVFVNTRVSPLVWLVIDWRKVSVIVHDLMDTSQDQGWGEMARGDRIRGYVNTWLIGRSISRAGCVICNSRYTQERLIAWKGESYCKSLVLRPPLTFSRDELSSHQFNGGYAGKECIHFLAVAGMSANKAIEDYFKWHRNVESVTEYKVKLTIYGLTYASLPMDSKEYVYSCAGRIRIKYRRPSQELLRDYLDCTYFLSLSREEGFGIPVADAVAFGVRVIARDIEAFREQREGLSDASGIVLAGDLEGVSVETEKMVEEVRRLPVGYYDNLERVVRYRKALEGQHSSVDSVFTKTRYIKDE